MSALRPGDVLRLDAHVVASIVEMTDTAIIVTGDGCRWTENRAILEADRRAGRIKRIAKAPQPSSADTRQRIALKLASPLRAGAGRTIERQHDTSDCPLFAAAEQGSLL